MDESWRMRMGMHNFPRRKSTEETSSQRSRKTFSGESGTMHPDDFSDVFGGPPRSVLSRQYSGDFTAGSRFSSFYEEIFRPADRAAPARSGRVLPAFRIPGSRKGGGGFYSDIFGSDDDRRSRTRSKPNSKSKSKSNSSSVLSSEELSPLRPVIGDDAALSTFASKLRPINVPSRWSSSMMLPDEYSKKQGMPAFQCNPAPYFENHFMKTEYDDDGSSSIFGFSQRVSFPETISVEPNSYGSVKVSIEDLELNSPSSAVSSVCQAPEAKPRIPDDELLHGQETEQDEDDDDDDDDDDEVMSSYVIEITPDRREGTDEADALDEAIAWAKEKFQTHSSEKEWSIRPHEPEGLVEMEDRPNSSELRVPLMDGHGMMQSTMYYARQHFLPAIVQFLLNLSKVFETEDSGVRTLTLEDKWATEDKQQMEKDMEMDLLDEDVRLWSSGKEANIRLLLSTLHHILWPNSGWYVIPLTSLIETSQVKKAYQKARLCLHPDKLQQRGVTPPQKYVAEKAFSILQDAWAAFISQDVFFSSRG